MRNFTMKWSVLFFLFISNFANAEPTPDHRLLEMPESNVAIVSEVLGKQITIVGKELVLAPRELLKEIGAILHQKSRKCGGFIDVTDESLKFFNESPAVKGFATSVDDEVEQEQLPYIFDADPKIAKAVNQVRPANIEMFANAFSEGFRTRVAYSEEGKLAAEWLAATWLKMATDAGRSDIIVELIKPHKGYNQNSVRITIPGSNADRGLVILGAHLDSINQGGSRYAPGVDDDASGIATLSETYRILLANNFRPAATVQFFGYAAEEVGLIGSRAIAQSYRENGAKVAGALQLDMTGYAGKTKAVTFIRDHTSDELTEWTQEIYKTYVGLAVVNDKCGYACSDHASWNRYKYRSVFPFESRFDDSNTAVHSVDDLWDERMSAEHAALFAKLAVAYTAELAR